MNVKISVVLLEQLSEFSVILTEVCQFSKRLNRVACFFNTMNMGMVRCADSMCDLVIDEHPSRVDYQKWYPRSRWSS